MLRSVLFSEIEVKSSEVERKSAAVKSAELQPLKFNFHCFLPQRLLKICTATSSEPIEVERSKKSCPILYSKLLYEMGQDFLDIQ